MNSVGVKRRSREPKKQAWGWNLNIRNNRGGPKSIKIGKLVEHNGQRIYHFWTRTGLLRRQVNGYGIREAALSHCLDHDVERFCLYEKESDTTYSIDYIGIMTHGIRGVEDDFGKTINVPRESMERIEGRLVLPYLPDGQCRYIQADHHRTFDVPDPIA